VSRDLKLEIKNSLHTILKATGGLNFRGGEALFDLLLNNLSEEQSTEHKQ